jgi:MoxR-like ATPase
VLPDDIQQMAVPVMAHRLLLHPEIMMSGEPATDLAARILTDVLHRIPIPRPGSARPLRHGR